MTDKTRVPEILGNSCIGCMHDEDDPNRSDSMFCASGGRCGDEQSIFIEDTDEAFAEYTAARALARMGAIDG